MKTERIDDSMTPVIAGFYPSSWDYHKKAAVPIEKPDEKICRAVGSENDNCEGYYVPALPGPSYGRSWSTYFAGFRKGKEGEGKKHAQQLTEKEPFREIYQGYCADDEQLGIRGGFACNWDDYDHKCRRIRQHRKKIQTVKDMQDRLDNKTFMDPEDLIAQRKEWDNHLHNDAVNAKQRRIFLQKKYWDDVTKETEDFQGTEEEEAQKFARVMNIKVTTNPKKFKFVPSYSDVDVASSGSDYGDANDGEEEAAGDNAD